MIAVNKNKCVGCGLCIELCPRSVITLKNDIADIDNDNCVGCQMCVRQCPQQALRHLSGVSIMVAFGTEDGKKITPDHFGSSRFFSVYKFTENGYEFIEQRQKVRYEEDESITDGDPGKAKAAAKTLAGIDCVVARIIGPNIARIRKKFVCAIIRKETVQEAIAVVQANLCTILEEKEKQDRIGIVLS